MKWKHKKEIEENLIGVKLDKGFKESSGFYIIGLCSYYYWIKKLDQRILFHRKKDNLKFYISLSSSNEKNLIFILVYSYKNKYFTEPFKLYFDKTNKYSKLKKIYNKT